MTNVWTEFRTELGGGDGALYSRLPQYGKEDRRDSLLAWWISTRFHVNFFFFSVANKAIGASSIQPPDPASRKVRARTRGIRFVLSRLLRRDARATNDGESMNNNPEITRRGVSFPRRREGDPSRIRPSRRVSDSMSRGSNSPTLTRQLGKCYSKGREEGARDGAGGGRGDPDALLDFSYRAFRAASSVRASERLLRAKRNLRSRCNALAILPSPPSGEGDERRVCVCVYTTGGAIKPATFPSACPCSPLLSSPPLPHYLAYAGRNSISLSIENGFLSSAVRLGLSVYPNGDLREFSLRPGINTSPSRHTRW